MYVYMGEKGREKVKRERGRRRQTWGDRFQGQAKSGELHLERV
jgi:hypothetical protein